jgi:hypothetical protein
MAERNWGVSVRPNVIFVLLHDKKTTTGLFRKKNLKINAALAYCLAHKEPSKVLMGKQT